MIHRSLYSRGEEGIEMTATHPAKTKKKGSEETTTSESDIIDAEWVRARSFTDRKMVIMGLIDAPGVVTTRNNTTHPQFDIHISIEGNNTYVSVRSRVDSSTRTTAQWCAMVPSSTPCS